MPRKRYPEEAKYKWLGPLLDTYEKTDKAVKADLKRCKDIPCKKGCSACCESMGIPINKLEMSGISWHVVEKLQGELKKQIVKNLEEMTPGQLKCPFLVDTSCGIYAVRPLACRTFYVHGRACNPGEDVTAERISAIHRPPQRKLKKAVLPMLAAMGITNRNAQDIAFDNGFLERESRQMHEINWQTYLLNNIKIFESTPLFI